MLLIALVLVLLYKLYQITQKVKIAFKRYLINLSKYPAKPFFLIRVFDTILTRNIQRTYVYTRLAESIVHYRYNLTLNM